MKFIVFNIVVAGALIYLVANNDTAGNVSLPTLDEISWKTEQLLDRASAHVPRTESAPVKAKPANPFSVLPAGAEVKAVAPADDPVVDAPVIDQADLAPPVAPPPIPEAPVAPARRVDVAPLEDAPAPTATPAREPRLAPAVAQRRAEVLSEAPALSLAPASPTADRRQQLLDLAEEMEFLAAEFSVR